MRLSLEQAFKLNKKQNGVPSVRSAAFAIKGLSCPRGTHIWIIPNKNNGRNYHIINVITSDKYFKQGASILDESLLDKNVQSVYFQKGNNFYLLMRKSDVTKKSIINYLHECDGGDKITVEVRKSSAIPLHILIQLFLNALSNYDDEELAFNNLTGHLYCYHRAWLKHAKNEISQIHSLEINVKENLLFLISVRTFSSEKLKSKIEFKKKKFEEYPKYVFGASRTLRRKLKSDQETSYIMRQIRGAKKEIPFLLIQNFEMYESSKIGMIDKIITLCNKKYSQFMYLSFKDYVETARIDYKTENKNENKAIIQDLLSNVKINVIDCIGDNYSKTACENLQNIFLSNYNKKLNFSSRLSKTALNIRLIHNKEYYLDNDDQYLLNAKGYVIQHITLEDFKTSALVTVNSIITELFIKEDLRLGKISLFNWEKLAFNKKWCFSYAKKTEEGNRYFVMAISPDGQFSIKEQELDLFSYNEYSMYVKMFVDREDTARCIVSDGENISIILDTDLFTLPRYEEIKEKLSKGDTYLRNEIAREELLSSCLDVKSFYIDGKEHFFVGIIGNGMQSTIQCAANVRAVEIYKGNLNFQELLPLMSVTFVRNGQLTILPFPIKYIKEYINLKG